MFEEERRDVGEEKAKSDIPEGMLLALPAHAAEAPAESPVQATALPVENALPDIPADAHEDFAEEEPFPDEPFEEMRRPRLIGTGKGKGRRLVKPEESPQPAITPEQRLLILDTWQRSGLPAGDFATLVGVSKHTLYGWKKKFDELGPAGLMERPRGGPKGSRVHELTKRTILMLKQANPEWGCQRISDMLLRGPALPASPTAVARVLHEAGYQMEEVTTRPHPDKQRQFERAVPNQLWQTDLFTFVLKRQNRRVYMVAFMDDNSRFITGYGLHASQSAAMVLEVVRAAMVAYGTPQEMLTDNGSQYVTWRGTSAFHREMDKRGIKHIVAKPQRPQTLGKIERFWGTLWRECIETVGVPRPGGRTSPDRALHRLLQLPATAPGDRWLGACRPFLRCGFRGLGDVAIARGGQCPGVGASRRTQGPVLYDRADWRAGLQRACRGRADDPQAGRGGTHRGGSDGARRCRGAVGRERGRLQGCGDAAAGLSRWFATQRCAAGGTKCPASSPLDAGFRQLEAVVEEGCAVPAVGQGGDHE